MIAILILVLTMSLVNYSSAAEPVEPEVAESLEVETEEVWCDEDTVYTVTTYTNGTTVSSKVPLKEYLER